jgi:archaellum biogenesis protein FlaJ (TadC family)
MIMNKNKQKKSILISTIIGLLLAIIIFLIKKNFIISLTILLGTPLIVYFLSYLTESLKKNNRIKKIELIFPDFLQLMSSNLRAGMTIDRAMLTSSRPEFNPLDEEIMKAGKDIATGMNTEDALVNMSKRIDSEKISKTINLIISGIRSGGNIAILLEDTAVSMREKEFVEKKAASSVMMYSIFIFLAVAIFAPALFSLSTVLVDVLTNILSGLPEIDVSAANMPFSFSGVSVSIAFIRYFSIIFMITIGILSSLVLGLVSKGKEKEGLKYLPAIIIISIGVFFLARVIISSFLSDII